MDGDLGDEKKRLKLFLRADLECVAARALPGKVQYTLCSSHSPRELKLALRRFRSANFSLRCRGRPACGMGRVSTAAPPGDQSPGYVKPAP